MPPTEPPCNACNAHEHLEEKFMDMKSRNYQEHEHIKIALTKVQTSSDWIVIIGSSLVAGIVGIFGMLWYLHTEENKVEDAVIEMKTDIKYIGIKIQDSIDEHDEIRKHVYLEIDKLKEKR